jgi:hypothetical protein
VTPPSEQIAAHPREIFVDGRRLEAQGGTIEIVNPCRLPDG